MSLSKRPFPSISEVMQGDAMTTEAENAQNLEKIEWIDAMEE